ncbi:MAG: M20/M25/M40 family metallo-hydrolase [Alphaproteobacteria bacterium]|nr:MAG: M20/M25/M40 family metallo-hydrolase [Alphaproteobacteria bacterium]
MTARLRHLLFSTTLCLAVTAPSLATPSYLEDVQAWRANNEGRIMGDFRDLLSMPNVSANAADMHKNADWIMAYLGARGFTSETVSAGGAPYILAERKAEGAQKTVLIYAHFDGQPVVPEDWSSPPFSPTLRDGTIEAGGQPVEWPTDGGFDPEWRLFARSAGDDKAPVIALMAAIDALTAAERDISVNIKLILDGEEEAGSPTLPDILAEHADKLQADLMLFCDGPMHQSRKRQLVFGVRGDMGVDITTYGAIRPLHSGHYGNWAPNPADRLMRLLSGMKDADGRIIVPGYSDDVAPISPAEQAAIDALPDMATALKEDLALGSTDGAGARIEELIMEPAIVVRGIRSAEVGDKGRNIIPSTATASLDLRLVPNQTPEGARASLTAYFESAGYYLTGETPTPDMLRAHEKVLKVDWKDGAYAAFRSSLDGAEAKKLKKILDGIGDGETLMTPTMGGSLPIYLFGNALDAPIILLPIANHDNNQHGRDENIRIRNLFDAIDTYAAVLVEFGRPDAE